MIIIFYIRKNKNDFLTSYPAIDSPMLSRHRLVIFNLTNLIILFSFQLFVSAFHNVFIFVPYSVNSFSKTFFISFLFSSNFILRLRNSFSIFYIFVYFFLIFPIFIDLILFLFCVDIVIFCTIRLIKQTFNWL